MLTATRSTADQHTANAERNNTAHGQVDGEEEAHRVPDSTQAISTTADLGTKPDRYSATPKSATLTTIVWWPPLTGIALVGVLFLLVGLDSVYATFRPTAGISAWLGFLALKVALVRQACKLTWQLLLDPAIAKQPAAQSLFTTPSS